MMKDEITIEQLADLPAGTYRLVDVRNDVSFQYGTIPDAIQIPELLEMAKNAQLSDDKEYILFCMHGTQSIWMAEYLQEQGYQARSLSGGYSSWLAKCYAVEDKHEQIEQGLRTRGFKEKLFSKFAKAIKTYEMLSPGDRVAVCISGADNRCRGIPRA